MKKTLENVRCDFPRVFLFIKKRYYGGTFPDLYYFAIMHAIPHPSGPVWVAMLSGSL